MHKLCLMRHARADWSQDQSDIERRLSERGRLEAQQMAQRLYDRQFEPYPMICSPALRASETAEIVSRQLGLDPAKIIRQDELYLASVDALLAQIDTHSDCAALMLVGHNPGLGVLVNRLAAGRIDNMPAAAYALFEIGGDEFSADNIYPASIDFPANTGEPFAA